jgi:hypothetical protein
MNTRKYESLEEISNEVTAKNAILPKTHPKKKPKSDLTLAFVNPSDYVNSLAIQSQRAGEIDRMRQNAVSYQWADSGSRKGKVVSFKDQLQAFKTLARDSTKAHAKSGPGLIQSLNVGPTIKQRPSRTMDAKGFKKRYSSVGIRQLGLTGITTPSGPIPVQ